MDGETSRAYTLFSVHNAPKDTFIKELEDALVHVKDSQLECIVGVHQKSDSNVKRFINYLLLPSFFEVVLKNGRVVCLEPNHYAEAATP